MNLRDTRQDIIQQVKKHSGHMVEALEEPVLNTVAVVHRSRRHVLPANIIRYRPSSSQPPDHLHHVLA